MFMTLRTKLLLGIAPMLVILLGLGLWAVVMFTKLGNNIDVILKENYRSVLAAQGMKEAVERLDSALLFAIGGEEAEAIGQFARNRPEFERHLRVELANITLPHEQEYADELVVLKSQYCELANQFLKIEPNRKADRTALYFSKILPVFRSIVKAANAVLDMNQRNMEDQSAKAREAAAFSIRMMVLGILVASALGTVFAVLMSRSILEPIRAVTRGAIALERGKLDQVVPVLTRDELGELATAFNTMARTLRELQEAGTTRLLRARKTAQAAIDSFPDPIVVVDTSGAVERANPAARRILGVVMLDDESALPWHPPAPIQEAIHEVLSGAPDALPSRLDQALCIRDAEHEKFFLPRVVAMRSEDGLLGAAVVLSDVTKFRLVDQLKSDMVSTVSHELKTPLTSIQMAIHLLIEEIVGPLNAKQIELVLAARQDSDRLVAMIDDLLDLTRIEQGRIRLEIRSIAPAAMIQTVIDRFQSTSIDKGVALVANVSDAPPAIAVDVDRIAHVFDNLLNNAFNHTPKGGSVTITADAAAGSGFARFSIADTGVGIAAEHLPHVFEKFYRPRSNQDDSTRGAGLGLAIAKEIVNNHGGEIEVGSEPGKGTIFRFTLPLARNETRPDVGGNSMITSA